ncbi:unnamed protein product [Candida verbasci]|uniref:Nodulin-like domain-containing protein n=1 Tax=Candida verbasci TaxID=1227364 RepID=A0A9W4TXR5_9ASCO|nr:unnamed protein product [Candida verbasci]
MSPKLNNEDGKQLVLDYMRLQYRPYSINDIQLNLHNQFTKNKLVSVLDELVNDRELVSKTIGKTTYYVYKEIIPEENDINVDEIKEEHTALSQHISDLKLWLQKIYSTPTNTQLINMVESSSTTFENLLDQLKSFEDQPTKNLDNYVIKITKMKKARRELLIDLVTTLVQQQQQQQLLSLHPYFLTYVSMISRNVQRVFVLLSCTFLGLICGTLYLYSSYSPQLAKQLGYTVSDSSYIALFGTIGLAVAGPISGNIVDKKGYSVSISIGGILLILGYSGLKKQFDLQWSNLNLSSFWLFSIGLGSTFINNACLKCCAISFPSIRGVATSLPLALYGLSALFYSVIASIFYPNDTSKYLGFLTYSIMVILIICFPYIYLADLEHKRKNKNSKTKYIANDYLFSNFKFWLIFSILGILASIGQMYIYSVGYMVKALIVSGDAILIQQNQQFQVGLISIANCIGRIISGVLGDIISQSFDKSRSWLLFLPAIGLTLTQIISYNLTDVLNLPINSVLIGFFYGFTFCIIPIIVGDLFGIENFSFNWGVVSLAPIIPSFYFTSLFGKIYDYNSQMLENTVVCSLGNLCYNQIFKLTGVASGMSILITILLNLKLKKKITALPLASLEKNKI